MNMDIVLLIIAICYPFIFKYLEQYFVQKEKILLKRKICVIFNMKRKKEKTSQQKRI